MKKRVALIFLIIIMIILNVSNTCASEEENIVLNILNYTMSLKVPKDFIVITQTTKKENFNINLFKFDLEELKQIYKNNNIYLTASSPDRTYEIFVKSCNSNTIKNLKTANSSNIQNLKSSIISNNAKNIMEYNTSKFKFLRWEEELSDLKYCVNNYTIVNGNIIEVNLISYEGELDPQQIITLNSIINSIDIKNSILSTISNIKNPIMISWPIIILLLSLLFTIIITILFIATRKSKFLDNKHRVKTIHNSKHLIVNIDNDHYKDIIEDESESKVENYNDDEDELEEKMENYDDEEEEIEDEYIENKKVLINNSEDLLPTKLDFLNKISNPPTPKKENPKKIINKNNNHDPNVNIKIEYIENNDD